MKRKAAVISAALSTAVLILAGCGSKVAGTPVPGPLPPDTVSVPVTPSHTVHYIVTADHDTPVSIIYLSTEPTVMPASRKPPFSDLTLLGSVTVGPGKPWTFSYTLKDPDTFRYVHASITGEVRAELHCLVSVDEVGTDNNRNNNSVSCPDRPDW